MERVTALARHGRDRPRAGRAHHGVGRPPGTEVRGVPDRGRGQRTTAVQFHRRAPSPGLRPRRAGGLEPGGLAGRLPARLRVVGLRLARRARHRPRGAGDVPVPHGGPRSCAAMDIRARHLARRRRASDVPDRLQRRVAGDPRRAGAGRMSPPPPRRRRRGAGPLRTGPRSCHCRHRPRQPRARTRAPDAARRGAGTRRVLRHRRRDHARGDRSGHRALPRHRRLLPDRAPARRVPARGALCAARRRRRRS